MRADDAATRAAAVIALGAILGDAAAATTAHGLLADPAPSVRRAAARVAAYGGTAAERADAVAVFAALMGDDDADLALTAAAELVALGDPRGADALSARLVRQTDASSPRLRAAGLHLTVARIVTPGLVAALADPDARVRVAAAHALIALGRR
ncbi:MAG: hypothetical protein R2939_19425 [Kofleriaceae bacterium]